MQAPPDDLCPPSHWVRSGAVGERTPLGELHLRKVPTFGRFANLFTEGPAPTSHSACSTCSTCSTCECRRGRQAKGRKVPTAPEYKSKRPADATPSHPRRGERHHHHHHHKQHRSSTRGSASGIQGAPAARSYLQQGQGVNSASCWCRDERAPYAAAAGLSRS